MAGALAVAHEECHDKMCHQFFLPLSKRYQTPIAKQLVFAGYVRLTFVAAIICATFCCNVVCGNFHPPNDDYYRKVDKAHGWPNIGKGALESYHAHADGIEASYRRSNSRSQHGYGIVDHGYHKGEIVHGYETRPYASHNYDENNSGSNVHYGSENGAHGGSSYGCPFLMHQDYGQQQHNAHNNGGNYYGQNYNKNFYNNNYDSGNDYGLFAPNYDKSYEQKGSSHDNKIYRQKTNKGYNNKKKEIYGFEKLVVSVNDVYDEKTLRPDKFDLSDLIYPAKEIRYGNSGYNSGGYNQQQSHADSNGNGGYGNDGYGEHQQESYADSNGNYNNNHLPTLYKETDEGYNNQNHEIPPHSPNSRSFPHSNGILTNSENGPVPPPPPERSTVSHTTSPTVQPPTPISLSPLSSTTTVSEALPPALPPSIDPSSTTSTTTTAAMDSTTTSTTPISAIPTTTIPTTTTTVAVGEADVPMPDPAALKLAEQVANSIPEPGPQSSCPGKKSSVAKCSPLFTCDGTNETFSCWHEPDGGKDQIFDAATHSCRRKSALIDCNFDSICVDEAKATLSPGQEWRTVGGACSSFAYNCDVPNGESGSELACIDPDTVVDVNTGGCVEFNQLASCRNS